MDRTFETYLEKKGLKYTRERKCIFAKVKSFSGHFDAEALYETLKKGRDNIARGTVFRTIPFLLESGVIQTSVGKGKGEFFERTDSKSHHDHILCVSCGKVIEYQCEEIEKLQEEVCKKYNVKLLFHDHKLFVRCGKCGKRD